VHLFLGQACSAKALLWGDNVPIFPKSLPIFPLLLLSWCRHATVLFVEVNAFVRTKNGSFTCDDGF
jgi:hypothetical protein